MSETPSHLNETAPQSASSASRSGYRDFLARVLTVALVASLLFLLWVALDVVFLAVTVLIVGVLLDALTRPVERWTPLPRRAALALVGVALVVLLAGFVWLIGAQVREQFDVLVEAARDGLRIVEEQVGAVLLDGEDGLGGDAGAWREAAGMAARFGITLVGTVGTIVLVVVGGFFLAADPHLYRRGVVKLFPKDRQGAVVDALDACGAALRQWLLAQLIAMAFVGAMVAGGTWAIGLATPLALGVFAGLVEFIPLFGPYIGAAPAVLLAVTQGWETALWTVLLFVVIGQIESNVITPIVQRREVEIPPALLLVAFFFFGLLSGVLGVVVATPLTILIFVLVRELYVRRTLGEEVGGGR